MLSLPKKILTHTQLTSVSLGKTEIEIPVAHFQNPGEKRIVITGGMDGDEYAGIEAANLLIKQYAKKPPELDIVILPIINIPGFLEKVSHNPIDNKYPKYTYPGKKNGSPTEQLIYWLHANYVSNADIWIDLHSGSLTEDLTPFIWAYQTKNKLLNQTTLSILSQLDTTKLYDKSLPSKLNALAKQNTAYFLLESGKLGEKEAKDIRRHAQWVGDILTAFQTPPTSPPTFSVYTKVHEYIATRQGVWHPEKPVGKGVQKSEVLGEIKSLKKTEQIIKAGVNGKILWQRMSGEYKKGETLIALASDSKTISSR